MKWSVEESIKASKALEQFNITWLEEPTIPDDIDGYRTIVKKSPFLSPMVKIFIVIMNLGIT